MWGKRGACGDRIKRHAGLEPGVDGEMSIDCAAVLASAYGVGLTEPPHFFPLSYASICCLRLCASIFLQLPAMDASARVTMKDAAKCDKHCELQNSVNQQNPERILCFRDIPESMSASESPLYPAALAWSLAASLRVRARPCLWLAAALTCLMHRSALRAPTW